MDNKPQLLTEAPLTPLTEVQPEPAEETKEQE